MSLHLTVTKDLSRLDARFAAGKLKQAQTRLAMQVGADSNKFCKVDTGATQASMQAGSNFEGGEVSWTTPYAVYAYYQPSALHQRNPNATSRWFETAKSQRLGDWTKLVRDSLDG